MTPPPAMTTSAVSIGVSPELEDALQRGESRDVDRVERRRDLNHIQPDAVTVLAEAGQEVDGLACRDASPRRNLRAWSKCGIENVDVKRNVEGTTIQPSLNLVDGVSRTGSHEVPRRDHQHPVLVEELHLL